MDHGEEVSTKVDFELVKEVLAGRRVIPLNGGASKVLYFMLHSDQGCDVTIDAHGFLIRYGWNPSKHPYYTKLAPSVVSQLMTWAGLETATDFLAFLLPAHDVPALDWPVAWAFGSRRVWFLPHPDGFNIFVRKAEPNDGSLADNLDPLPAPIRTRRIVAKFTAAVVCEHCSHASLQFRSLGDALVCGNCGRSFRPPREILSAAHVEEGS